jgi:hypothetical protein
MSRFTVEKDRVAASLSLTTGQTVTGCFFVLGSLATAVGRERVGDLLNAEDGFFPFQREDGTTAQYNRAHLAFVRLPAGVDEEALEPGYDVAQRRNVVMTLSTGARIDGTIALYGPVGYDRLSDYARRAKHRFQYVVTPFGSVIVNADHIVDVYEKAE